MGRQAVNVDPEVYERLVAEAERTGESIDAVVERLLKRHVGLLRATNKPGWGSLPPLGDPEGD